VIGVLSLEVNPQEL